MREDSRRDRSSAVAMRPAFEGDRDPPVSRCLRLVLVEQGTRALDAPGGDADAVRVVQSSTERPTAFALRAVRRVLAIEQSGRSIGSTSFLLAPRFDPEVTAARLLIARGLITHSASVGGEASELLLRAAFPSPHDLQQSLPSLMDALLGEAGSWVLPLSASFDTGRTES
jgi:hypothetical protein